MGKSAFPKGLIAGILVAVFFGVALYLRVVLPYDTVFGSEWTKFTGADVYYFMRQVDNIAYNLPHSITFDPYFIYPGSASLGSISFFVYLISGIAWLVSLGSPTQHTIDMVGVYLPAILGALSIIPVYFIGKAIFNRWAGVIAAGLLAIAPGPFLNSSILGFADRDALEVLLTVLTMLFFILAINSARQQELGSNLRLLGRNIIKPLIYSLFTGIFMGLYLLTWRGAFLFVFIISAYLVIQAIVDHLKHKNINYLGFIGTVTFLVALILFLPSHPLQAYLAAVVIAVIIPPVLAVISWLMSKTTAKAGYYPLALFGLGLLGLAIVYAINSSILSSTLSYLQVFFPSETKIYNLEMRPLLFPSGYFSFSAAWYNFTTGSFLSLISLGILIYLVVKHGDADKTLLLVWSLVILVATLALRRIGLLYAINVALLSAYLAWLILEFAGLRKKLDAKSETSQQAIAKLEKKKKRRRAASRTWSWANISLAIVVVFFLFFFPNIAMAQKIAKNPPFAPSDGWCESLSWMKDNTPEPFGDPDFYYTSYTEPFKYPENAYGVTAWWNYGYFITRIGHRPPTCNPAGSRHYSVRQEVASLFTAQSEAAATPIISKLKSRYIIIDYITSIVTKAYYIREQSYGARGLLPAIATYAGSSSQNFYDVYYTQEGGELKPVILFYPEYYRSLMVRLYNFDGGEVIPQASTVVSYEEKVGPGGDAYRQITSIKPFPSYQGAEAYVAKQASENVIIAGTDPLVSPVPLEKLDRYKLVYSSTRANQTPVGGLIPEVKIFEYISQ